MDSITMELVLPTMAASLIGLILLCASIARRNRQEARRELFGLPPGKDAWP